MRLITVRGIKISKGITNLISSPNIIKVRNQLLDGSFHIQTIGNPYTSVALTLEVDQAGKKALDDAYVYDTLLELRDGREYTRGLMEDKPTVTAISLSKNYKLYSVDLTLVASEVGWYN